LLTGFGPFLAYKTNPSGRLAEELNGTKIGAVDIVGKVIGVEHGTAYRQVAELIESQMPDIIVAVGLAAMRAVVSLERVALNRFYFASKDVPVVDEPLDPQGKAAYFSTLPLEKIKAKLENIGIPAEHSFSADTYVSNEVFYSVMRHAEKLGIKKAGFIHLPLTPEMVVENKAHPMVRMGMPSMSYETMRKAITTAIAAAAME
jgi:pyroglutamyl-peptidase